MRSARVLGLAIILLADPLLADGIARPQLEEAEAEVHMQALRASALEELRAKQVRVTEVHQRLQVGAAGYCGDEVGPILGASIGRRRDFLRGHEKEAEEAFGAVDEVKVFVVASEGPAERAGLRKGDLIVSVDGQEVKKTQNVYDALRSSEEGEPRIEIARDGAKSTVSLPRVEGCHHGVIVIAWGSPDTFAHRNKKEMYIPTGLVRFAQNDDELALGIAHQLAHHVLGTTLHKDADDEPPADRLGLYMAAASGFEIASAPAFWDRLAANEPAKILFNVGSGSRGRRYHVGMPARAVAIRDAVAEIREKIANEEPLVP